MEQYSFEKLWQELHDGYQVYYTYMKNRYLLYKVADNCYKQEIIHHTEKTPHPKFSMLTLKRVKELYPYMEDIEYKVGIYEQ